MKKIILVIALLLGVVGCKKDLDKGCDSEEFVWVFYVNVGVEGDSYERFGVIKDRKVDSEKMQMFFFDGGVKKVILLIMRFRHVLMIEKNIVRY